MVCAMSVVVVFIVSSVLMLFAFGYVAGRACSPCWVLLVGAIIYVCHHLNEVFRDLAARLCFRAIVGGVVVGKQVFNYR
jgi:hypothetical protein